MKSFPRSGERSLLSDATAVRPEPETFVRQVSEKMCFVRLAVFVIFDGKFIVADDVCFDVSHIIP